MADVHKVSVLPVCTLLTAVLLAILSISGTHTTAFAKLDNMTIECIYEDISVYEDGRFWNWWYDTNLTYGTLCSTQCSPNCSCSLGSRTVIINCTNDNVSIPAFYYSTDVKFLSWEHSIVHNIQKDAFTGLASMLEKLHLNNISLRSLESGVFDGMIKLERLGLSCNRLTSIQPGVFDGMIKLERLDLSFNRLITIQPGVFHGLAGLKSLDLSNNMLDEIHPYVFDGLAELQFLKLNSTMLNEIYPDAFLGLAELQWLYLGHNMLNEINPGAFHGLEKLRILVLFNNNLDEIHPSVLNGLTELNSLNLKNNKLDVIHADMFKGLPKLQSLNLKNNMMHEIHAHVFNGSAELQSLYLDDNMLDEIHPDVFDGLAELTHLHLNDNKLNKIHPDTFKGLAEIQLLSLWNNTMDKIHPSTFSENYNLLVLWISHNQLSSLHPDTFQNLSKLDWLSLSHNQIQYLPDGIFRTLVQLRGLDLSANRLSKLDSHLFHNCIILEILNLTQNTLLWLKPKVFSELNNSTIILVDHYATCCFVTSATCHYGTPKSAYLTCERLLPYDFLRIGIWVVSLVAILGNTVTMYTRCRQKQSNKVQFFLITNLSISDLVMGIYLMILLSVDLYYKDYFPSHSDSWRKSILCRGTGALSVLSSEASVFFITLISIDRFLGIKYPFSGHRLGTKSVKIIVSLLWLVAFTISLTSFILSGLDSDMYAVSEICVGLPISRKNLFAGNVTDVPLYISLYYDQSIPQTTYQLKDSKVGMYFSIAMFTGLNLLCFLIVGYCYMAIFIAVRKSGKESARPANSNDDIRMAKKMSLIVLTDFFCWVPLGVLSIFVQSGAVTVNPMAYAWIATFVMPINSSINPFLYTLANKISNRPRYNQGGSRTAPLASSPTVA